jgi:ABC-type transport system substrate-binding protein
MRVASAWLAIAAVIIAVGGVASPTAAEPAGMLVVGLVAEPVNLDPAQVTDLNSNRVGRRIVETLVTFPEESTQVVPGLAESWTVSKDGLRYTFKLRKGITFHDGTVFTAEAVKFSIERQIDPDHPFNKLGKYPFANYNFGNVNPLLHSSQWTPTGPNRALYKNARFDELLHQAWLTTDQGKRAEFYREAQRILVDDPPWIFIDHEIQTAAHAKRVQGLKLHPSFDLRAETISLK